MLAAAAPLAAAPVLARYGLDSSAQAAGHEHGTQPMDMAAMGHAAMIGEEAPAVGGPHDLDSLLYPPPALPYEPGRIREYSLIATDRDIEIAPGVFFPAWTYNGTVPGPVIRATEGDMLRVKTEGGEFQVEVLTLSEMRGPAAVAQTLYCETDHSKELRLIVAEERKTMRRIEGLREGKPSKRDRRLIHRFRGDG